MNVLQYPHTSENTSTPRRQTCVETGPAIRCPRHDFAIDNHTEIKNNARKEGEETCDMKPQCFWNKPRGMGGGCSGRFSSSAAKYSPRLYSGWLPHRSFLSSAVTRKQSTYLVEDAVSPFSAARLQQQASLAFRLTNLKASDFRGFFCGRAKALQSWHTHTLSSPFYSFFTSFPNTALLYKGKRTSVVLDWKGYLCMRVEVNGVEIRTALMRSYELEVFWRMRYISTNTWKFYISLMFGLVLITTFGKLISAWLVHLFQLHRKKSLVKFVISLSVYPLCVWRRKHTFVFRNGTFLIKLFYNHTP